MRVVPGRGTGVGGMLDHQHRLRGKGGCRRKHLGEPLLRSGLRCGQCRSAVFLKMRGTEARPTKVVGNPGEHFGQLHPNMEFIVTPCSPSLCSLGRCVHFCTGQTWCAQPHQTLGSKQNIRDFLWYYQSTWPKLFPYGSHSMHQAHQG